MRWAPAFCTVARVVRLARYSEERWTTRSVLSALLVRYGVVRVVVVIWFFRFACAATAVTGFR
jgi:hypothetical protein